MAVAFDAASTNIGVGSWNHTCTGTGLALLVFPSTWIGVDVGDVSAITYNGVALSRFPTTDHAFNTGRIEGWYLLNPATGTHSIVTTGTASDTPFTAISLTGVDTTSVATALGTPQANTGNSSTPTSTAISAAVGNMVVDAIGILCGAGCTVGTGFTQIGSVAPCNPKQQSAYGAGTGGALSNVWTGYTQDSRWADLAVEVKAPVAAITEHNLAIMGVGK